MAIEKKKDRQQPVGAHKETLATKYDTGCQELACTLIA
jgi:hypothetical protein